VDGAPEALDDFGYSVSIDGDTAIVGKPGDNSDTGSAIVYVRSGGSWTQQQELTASDGASGDQFGISVSIDGDTAIVGALGDDNFTGSAYAFTRSGSTWTQKDKLTASDAAEGDRFGSSVSVSGDTALVGAPQNDSNTGSAYVFVRAGELWPQQGVPLIASDGVSGDFFGTSVSVSGDTALIGADYGDGVVADSGSAYVFVRSGNTWTQQQELTASDGAANDRFGYSVSIDGDAALVGAYNDDGAGSTYAFVRSGSTWTQQDKLTASDGASGDLFGESVSIDGDTALVGAGGDDSFTGSAYVFVKARTSSDWAESIKITSSDAATNEEFGNSVSISGSTALVGSWRDGGSTGAAFFNLYECGFGGNIPASKWTMIGIPCDLGSANTVGDVFGDDFPGSYLYDWILYQRIYGEETDSYSFLSSLTSTLEHGKSYWMFSYTQGVWDASGTTTQYTIGGLCTAPKGCFEIPLTSPNNTGSSRANLVGYIGNATVDWADVKVVVDGTAYTPSVANDTPELDNGYVSKTIYKYTGSGYDSFDDATPALFGQLKAQEGFWVEVRGAAAGKSVSLLVPKL
jgi:hypothetical protein